MDKSTAENPLVTPSASPPVSRPLPPPPKKQQRAVSRSAPSPVSRAAAGADFDLHGARRESSNRVLDVWSQLAKRYARRLDEDDIVDLESETVVKDRGVLRGSSQYDFGCFAEGDDLSTTGGSDGAADVDDDLDELDSFAIEADISDEMEKQLSRTIPPVQVMDPADEEDLKEFLEAERKRKMLCGDEDDLDDDDLEYVEDSEGNEDLEEELADEHVDDLGVVEHSVPHSSDCSDEDQDFDEPSPRHTQEASPDPSPQGEGSDDELGEWDVNEGNTVYLLPKDSDSPEVEILPSSPPPALEKPSPSRHRRGRPKSVSDRIVKTKTTASPNKEPGTVRSSRRTQLHTPPQSSSSVTDNTPDSVLTSPPVEPCSKHNVTSANDPLVSEVRTYDSSDGCATTPKKKTYKSKVKQGAQLARKRSKEIAKVDVEKVSPTRRPKPRVILSDTESKTSPLGHLQSLSPDCWSKELAPERLPSSESDDPITLLPSPEPPSKRRPSCPPIEVMVNSGASRTTGRKRKRATSSIEPPDIEGRDSYAVTETASSPLRPRQLANENYRDPAPRSSSSVSLDNIVDVGSSRGSAKMPSKARKSHSFSDSSVDSWLDCPPSPQLHTIQSAHVMRHHHAPPYNAPPPFAPFTDPRAQLIISQAVHQLSCLMTGNTPGQDHPSQPWSQASHGKDDPSIYQGFPYFPYQTPPWPPFTPTHHSHPTFPSASARSSRQSSTVTTPSHPHPYPYSFAPSLSGGTLPPSSPEPPLSSPSRSATEPSSPPIRAKSLVKRSKSRGRRVSFRLEGEEVTFGGSQSELDQDDLSIKLGLDGQAGHIRGRSRKKQQGHEADSSRNSLTRESHKVAASRERDKSGQRSKSPYMERAPTPRVVKGKGKARADSLDDERGSSQDLRSQTPPADSRRRFARGQTPGPPATLK